MSAQIKGWIWLYLKTLRLKLTDYSVTTAQTRPALAKALCQAPRSDQRQSLSSQQVPNVMAGVPGHAVGVGSSDYQWQWRGRHQAKEVIEKRRWGFGRPRTPASCLQCVQKVRDFIQLFVKRKHFTKNMSNISCLFSSCKCTRARRWMTMLAKGLYNPLPL